VGKNGRLTVTKSMGLKDPYSGSANLVTGEIAEDFTAYYAISEQQPTAIALGVKIGKDLTCIGAGGVIIQALPFAEEKNLVKAEKIISELKNVSTQIEELGALGVLKKYFGDVTYQEYIPEYKCLCSREYIERVLISLGKDEINDIIDKEGVVKVGCQFCNKEYVFDKNDAEKLFE
jgi:molecular chaperone Hsp33